MSESDQNHDLVTYPGLRSGARHRADSSTRAWTTAAWLLAVEARAFLEDLDGGRDQPAMQNAVKIRLANLLYEIDARLRCIDPADPVHRLALLMEYGTAEVALLHGEHVIEALDLGDALSTEEACTERARALWDRLIRDFPGDLPDPLVPSGQSEILRALQLWSKLCERTGADPSFLRPLLADA